MTDSVAPKIVETNPRIPTVLGIFNILIGALILLYWLGLIAWSLAMPALTEQFLTIGQRNRLEQMSMLEARIAALKAESTKSQTSEARKQAIREEITDLELDLELDYGDLRGGGAMGLGRTIHYWADVAVGVVANVLLIYSGLGLMALRPWSRTMALWLAAFKVAWLTAMTALAFMVIIPQEVRETQTTLLKMEAREQRRNGGGSPLPFRTPADVAAITAQTSAAFTTTEFLISLAYPLLILWLLNKQTVKDAIRLSSPGEATPVLVAEVRG
jgi:hypothetical protein